MPNSSIDPVYTTHGESSAFISSDRQGHRADHVPNQGARSSVSSRNTRETTEGVMTGDVSPRHEADSWASDSHAASHSYSEGVSFGMASASNSRQGTREVSHHSESSHHHGESEGQSVRDTRGAGVSRSYSEGASHSYSEGVSFGTSAASDARQGQREISHGPETAHPHGVSTAHQHGVSEGRSVRDTWEAGGTASVGHASSFGSSRSPSHEYSHSTSFGASAGTQSHGHTGESHSFGGSSVSRSGMATLCDAIQGQLENQGMAPEDAMHAASNIGPAVAASWNQGSHEALNFHREGDVAVSIGGRISHQEGLAVPMDTLKSIHDHGMPHSGVDELRNHLGSELNGKSDLHVVGTFGHDVTRAVGEQGFPSSAVALLQAEQDMSKTEALQTLGNEARARVETPARDSTAPSAQGELSH